MCPLTRCTDVAVHHDTASISVSGDLHVVALLTPFLIIDLSCVIH